ncbi:hypothetical protein GQ53DRAFT_791004 [Thozetella sp. PMI_491]|nr:hypothetical protein GQ53DRAFT_791004 [Thozetella sp. PMI_491]
MDVVQALRPPSAKQLRNEEALKIYAGFLCSLIAFVTVARRLRGFLNKSPGSKASNEFQYASRKGSLLVLRTLDRRPDWKWLGRPSYGLIILVVIYVIGNAVLSATHLASYRVNHWASRFGWLGAANMALCVFFGLKNTPLAPAAGISHTQLNILHRVAGYTATFLVLLHAIFYTVHFGLQGRWETLIEEGNIQGIASGVAMLILLMGVFRHRAYETFYITHVTAFVAVVILTGLHRPDWAKKLPVVMVFIASIWTVDRIIRAARMSYHLLNNQAALYPLPDGATRLLLKKPRNEAALPGSHIFLWIPRLRLYEVHPFTIVSNGPVGLELIIKPQEGFTRAVSDFAARHHGRTVWASVDGPYGSLPDIEMYDKLVLIAGGAGAAFTFGFVNYVLSRSERAKALSIEFIWAVKRTEHLTWFLEHLQRLAAARPTVKLRLYITSEKPTTNRRDGVRATLTSASEEVQDAAEDALLSNHNSSHYGTLPELRDIDKLLSAAGLEDIEYNGGVKFTKMDTETVIREAMASPGHTQQALLAACGPKLLMDAVRDSADVCRTQLSCRIDVHCEDFGSC